MDGMSVPVRLAPHPFGVGDVVSNTFAILRSRFGLFLGLTLVPVVFLLVMSAAGAVAGFVVLGGFAQFGLRTPGSLRGADSLLAGS